MPSNLEAVAQRLILPYQLKKYSVLSFSNSSSTPTMVTLPERIVLRNVYCGVDGTMAVSANGSLLACGRNSYNKLGLSQVKLFPPGQKVGALAQFLSGRTVIQ